MDFQKLLLEARQTNALAKQGQLLPVKPISTTRLFNLVQTQPETNLWDTRNPEDFARSHFRGARNGTTAEWARQQFAQFALTPFQKITLVLIGDPPDDLLSFVQTQYDSVKVIWQIASDELERVHPYLFISQDQESRGIEDQAVRRAFCSYPAIFLDNLLCGTIVHGSQFEQLKLLGITVCMDLTPNGIPNLPAVEGIEVLRPPADADIFDCAAMLNPEARTLVFDVGSEKAPSIICAYFMRKHADWTPTTTIAFVINKVPKFKPAPKSYREILRGPPEKLASANVQNLTPLDVRQLIMDEAENWHVIPPDTDDGRIASKALASDAEALNRCRELVVKGVIDNRKTGVFSSIRCFLGALLLRDDSSPSPQYKDAVAELWEQVKDGGTPDLEDVLAGRFPMADDGLPMHMSDLLRPLVLRLGIIVL